MKKLSKFRNIKMNQQSGRCYYCSQPMWESDSLGFCERYRLSPKQANHHRCTAEHLQAKCEGGQDTLDNIVAACHFCNKGRHSRCNPPLPDYYAIFVRRRLATGKWHGFVAMPL